MDKTMSWPKAVKATVFDASASLFCARRVLSPAKKIKPSVFLFIKFIVMEI